MKKATPEIARTAATTIRSQLIWAALFPLTAFGLLSVLLITSAFQSLALNQALSRDTTLAQVAAVQVNDRIQGILAPLQEAAQNHGPALQSPSFNTLAAELNSQSAGLLELDANGVVVGASPALANWLGKPLPEPVRSAAISLTPQVLTSAALAQDRGGIPAILISTPILIQGKLSGSLVACLAQGGSAWLAEISLPVTAGSNLSIFDPAGYPIAQTNPPQPNQLSGSFVGQKGSNSQLLTSPVTGEQVIYSYAPVPGTEWELVLEEPWQAVYAPAVYYEGVLISLLVLGVVLSVVMLSVSIGRVINPLGKLSRQADALGPGSVFRPLPEEGAEELRSLTHAFNQMVIRLAEQQAALRQYAEKALLSQEEERQRISHELHDETVQELIGLLQRLDLCRTEMDKDPGLARSRLDELKSLAETALNDLRRISNALRPSILQDLGLPATLRSLCDELERQMPEVVCEFSLVGEERRLAPELELAVFRVVQEALGNIRRHSSQVTQVSVRLKFDLQGVRAVIRDDGVGFVLPEVHELIREGHFGVAGMYERARLFGGELTIRSEPETGATITLWLPVEMGIIIRSDPVI